MARKTLEDRLSELSSKDVTERMKALETIARRALRRRADRVSGILLPFPIGGCQIPDVDRTVFRTIFPVDGTLVRVLLDVEGVENIKGGVTAEAEFRTENDLYSRTFHISKRLASMDIELPVLFGTRMRVSVTTGEVVGYVWTGLLFIPEISSSVMKRFLLEDLKNAKEA